MHSFFSFPFFGGRHNDTTVNVKVVKYSQVNRAARNKCYNRDGDIANDAWSLLTEMKWIVVENGPIVTSPQVDF